MTALLNVENAVWGIQITKHTNIFGKKCVSISKLIKADGIFCAFCLQDFIFAWTKPWISDSSPALAVETRQFCDWRKKIGGVSFA